ncbi:ribonuclease domain-containing protein [Actinocrispum sp. NPDC049592]|uniref:ribonuclease domain-containing protein n=1 Tax=Actinocrispum sp. NPDC049592 TaxID=3154835 RepID=UPI003443D6AF
MGSRRRITFALIGLVVLVVVGWFVRDAVKDDPAPAPQQQSQQVKPQNGMQVKPLSKLPPEAVVTWRTIQKGGPFKSSRDGIVFENREKLLPAKSASYYHEYTVPTPGADDRGARRLITGESKELYYTDDHYASFVLVDTGK